MIRIEGDLTIHETRVRDEQEPRRGDRARYIYEVTVTGGPGDRKRFDEIVASIKERVEDQIPETG